jgi:hypothetical protein
MFLQKIKTEKNYVNKLVFSGILKVSDENGWIRIQDPDPGSGSRIRIQIH